jgi:hypothetical protein
MELEVKFRKKKGIVDKTLYPDIMAYFGCQYAKYFKKIIIELALLQQYNLPKNITIIICKTDNPKKAMCTPTIKTMVCGFSYEKEEFIKNIIHESFHILDKTLRTDWDTDKQFKDKIENYIESKTQKLYPIISKRIEEKHA